MQFPRILKIGADKVNIDYNYDLDIEGKLMNPETNWSELAAALSAAYK